MELLIVIVGTLLMAGWTAFSDYQIDKKIDRIMKKAEEGIRK